MPSWRRSRARWKWPASRPTEAPVLTLTEHLSTRPATLRRPWIATFGYALIGAVLVWSWYGAEMRPLELFRDSGNVATFLRDFFPPDFHEWRLYLQEMVVTIQIAVWGTALAIVAAVPLGLACAGNIAPCVVH